ncbi:MAG: DivIVA domain-containing protein [Bacilli bacterium]|nr:DivIVA domain-containing protein [Bacilli bacterium]
MKKFSKSFSGYNTHEVNAFVDDVVKNVDEMLQKMKAKDMEIDRLTKELEHYKSMDATLNRAIVMAEESSKKYRESSLNESDLIITEAKKNANRIINDALTKAEHIEEESQRMRRNIITYKRRIKNLIDQQAELVEDLDKVDL